MKICKNLRNFKTSLNLNPKLLEVLVSCRSLEKLHLLFDLAENNRKISQNMIDVIKRFGKNLLELYFEFSEFEHGITQKKIIEELETQFATIQVRENARNFFELEASNHFLSQNLG